MVKNGPVTAVIVGAGHRSLWYGKYALQEPDKLRIVGVADPNPVRREYFARQFGIPEAGLFASAEELAAAPKMADAVINGTMDHQHVATALPLLAAGYDMLIEKPFAVNMEEMERLARAAKQYHNKVMICHVLRYAPFYQEMRRRVLRGDLGEITSIEAAEYVSYHHMATCYVRGKWRDSKACHAGLLLAKSCHDMDIIMWLKSGVKPARVASFGSIFEFRPERCPEGAGTMCMVDCPIEDRCVYSAKKMYIDHPDRWSFYVWDRLEHIERPTIEDKIAELKKPDNYYGRCVWKCGNDVVDHQNVAIEFADGSTASFILASGSGKDERTIHICGTRAEIYGSLEQGYFTVRSINPAPGCECDIEEVRFDAQGGHGGGDQRLVVDFVEYLRGGEPSISLTKLDDSINGHMAVFLAEQSRQTGQVCAFPEGFAI